MFSVCSESDMIGTWGLPSDVMELSTFGTVISFYSFFNQNFLLITGGKLALVDSVPIFLINSQVTLFHIAKTDKIYPNITQNGRKIPLSYCCHVFTIVHASF